MPDQPLDAFGPARGRRLVVAIAHLDPVRLAADRDAALVVDLVDGEIPVRITREPGNS